MGGEHDLPPCFHDKPDGGERKEYTGIIGNLILFVQRNIKIDSDEYPFSLSIQFDLLFE
jgi:hypothetical protein